jgi:hypothetical protein
MHTRKRCIVAGHLALGQFSEDVYSRTFYRRFGKETCPYTSRSLTVAPQQPNQSMKAGPN